MFSQWSLSRKLLVGETRVGVVAASAVAALLYVSSVQPVRAKVEQQMQTVMAQYIQGQIDLKVQAGIMGAASLSLDPRLPAAMELEERDTLMDLMSGLKSRFAEKTDYKNIAAQVITADGRALIKSWEIDSWGQQVGGHPLIKRAMADRQALGALGVGALGVTVVSVSPILQGKELIGAVTFIQGLASVAKDFRRQMQGEWVLLLDHDYIASVYGDLPSVSKNPRVGEKMLLASDKWFDAGAVELIQRSYQPASQRRADACQCALGQGGGGFACHG